MPIIRGIGNIKTQGFAPIAPNLPESGDAVKKPKAKQPPPQEVDENADKIKAMARNQTTDFINYLP